MAGVAHRRDKIPATQEQRQYLTALASKLGTLMCAGDPTPSRIVREANLSNMDYDYAARLTSAAEDAIRALESGHVVVGPWGRHYESA